MRVGLVRNVALGMVALVAFGLAGCDDNPTDFDADDTTRITTNPSVMTVPAGVTTLLESRTENAGNEPTWEEVTATVDATCGSGTVTVAEAASYEPSIQPPGVFDVTGGTTLGETCIELSGGGVSATVEVTVVGDSLVITNAPATIEPATGTTTVQLGASLLSDLGDPVSPFDPTTDLVWESDNEDVLIVDQTGFVTAVGAGSATITATWTGGGVTISEDVTIEVLVPAPTLTSAPLAAPVNDVIAISGSGFIAGFHSFFVNGIEAPAFVQNQILSPTAAEMKIPAGDIGVDIEIAIGTAGDLSNALTVTVLESASEPANNDPSTAPVATLPITMAGTVDALDLDDFYRFTLTETTTIHLFLDWVGDSSDLDLLVVDAAFTAFQCNFVTATGAHPEEGDCTLDPGDYALWVNSFDELRGDYFLSAEEVTEE